MSIHFKNSFIEEFLPGVNNRKVYIDVPKEISGYNSDFQLSLEVWNNSWSILENEHVRLQKDIQSPHPIGAGLKLICEHKLAREKFTVIVEESYSGYTAFDKYHLNQAQISIGNADGNDITYNYRSLVSGRHAQIEKDSSGSYRVVDQNSSNGTFVNGKRVSGSQRLSYGDMIYILGLKIVYLGDVIAINQPQSPAKLVGFAPYVSIDTNAEQQAEESDIDEYYQRSPRQIEMIDEEAIEIEGPPNTGKSKRQPLIFTIGPSFTMIIPMAAGVMFTMWSAQQQSNNAMSSPFMFMGIITSVTSAVIGVFWALANHRYSTKIEKMQEERRCSMYRKYLEKMRQLLTQKHIENKEVLTEKYPETHECMRFVKTGSRRLWERNVNHLDFLTIRLGNGQRPSPNEITIPKERFSLVDDELAEEPLKIKGEYSMLKDAPICLSLNDHNLVGIIGNSNEACISIAQVIAIQLAAYHSYTDVRMVFVYNEKNAQQFEFARWLPHVWTSDGNLRLLACDQNSVGEVFYFLSDMLRGRMETDNDTEGVRNLPHYVIFIADPLLVENEAVMKYLIAPNEQMGISTVLVYEQIGRLPNNCTVIIQSDNEYSGYYSLDSSFVGFDKVGFDNVEPVALTEFSRELSGTRVREMQSNGAIPQMLTFLDMYKTNSLDKIDVARRWLENRAYESMKAMIGYRGTDMPLYLDIHEKYHGPHGLVAGTTGSGKSETLQTYILSLALNYHPYEVSFILIDYKGGGMAGSFEKLPHVAGIITNLGGNQTNRALASINSEIKRRQAIFNEYKLKHIDSYIELYRVGKASMPVPHLIIIADEFAELKKEQPEFVRELVSASRIGRSLGVHLILATQKPSGVVDEEIWGNSKFRLCLRVQDKQDSNEMIRRPDAAYITNAGRGFFQVGNDEIFEAFQSGWSGASYEPELPYNDTKQGDAKMINLLGKPCVVGTKKSAPKEKKEKKQTQLEAAVLYIIKAAEQQQVKAIDNIWLPPLPTAIYLSDMNDYNAMAFSDEGWKEGEWELAPVIGIMDDPVNQRQMPVAINLLSEGHILVSGSGSGGKTTLLQTLLYSTVTCYSPKRVNIYIADFGSRTMGVFENLPHVGGVAFDNDIDKIDKLIAMLLKELNRRKAAFSEKGIGAFKEYVRLYDDVPAVIFAIDNFAAFKENCPKQEDNLILLSREAASYGIYIVMTCSNVNDIRGKIRQNFSYGIGLQLPDRFEYEAALNSKTDIVAEDKTPGRGLLCSPGPLEFQTAVCMAANDAVALNMGLKKRFEELTAAWKGETAPAIPQVPSDMSYSNFITLPEVISKLNSGLNLPLGYDLGEAAPECVDLSRIFCYSISGTGRSGKTNMLKVFMRLAKLTDNSVYVFDGPNHELENFTREISVDRYIIGSDELYDFLQDTIIPEFTVRNRRKAEFVKNGRKDIESYITSDKKIFLFISDMVAFCEAVYSSERDMKGFLEQVISRGDQHLIYLFACIAPSDLQGEMGTKRLMRGFINWKDGIHLGGDVEHQRIFDFDVPMLQRSKKLPAGIGNIISNGVTKCIKTPEL
jgi:S-DNA-T family DNA segregation ATPase FtsK/SpoIIIE